MINYFKLNKIGAFFCCCSLTHFLFFYLQGMEQIRRIMRPTDVPDTGLLCDLLWSDPDKDVQVRI